MGEIGTGNAEPSVVRFRATLFNLKGTLAVLQRIKRNHIYCEVKLETIDATIAEFDRAIIQYENYILEAGGTL